ncbi:MAG: hypothetical protein ACC656_11975, partial [Candidatus Heimdallarchaeota archaeon]
MGISIASGTVGRYPNALDVLKDQKEHSYALAVVAGKDWKDYDFVLVQREMEKRPLINRHSS